jgi:hypothetical protein
MMRTGVGSLMSQWSLEGARAIFLMWGLR